MIVVWLFLTMPLVCLQFVIVLFPDHTHLLFFEYIYVKYIKYLILIRARNYNASAELSIDF